MREVVRVTEIERRNRLVGQAPAEQTYGEGFIAVHMKDGGVVTISGIVDMVKENADMEDHISWHGDRPFLDITGWNVTVHFIGNIVEEYRPLDGKEATK